MEAIGHLMTGFATALSPMNLLFATIGCILGTLIGVLPGLGPAAGTALLIPITFKLDPTAAIIMLAAIYYGAMYGGTITSVLINVPGEAASVVTCLDGYEMAKQGRAGAALGVAAVGSFIGGTVATFGLVLVALPLTRFALKFGPPEYFSLLLVGLSLVMGLAGKSLAKALTMGIIGLVFSLVGVDPIEGAPRFTFGITPLMDGIRFVPVVMGFFGIGEILINAEKSMTSVMASTDKVSSFFPRRSEVGISLSSILRGTGLGFFLGLIPGTNSAVASFMSYAIEKKLSKHPEKFGTGVIEGVAAPETANNAYANAALIPLFTLGLPGSPTIAILMGALIMNGLTPGPLLLFAARRLRLGGHRQPLHRQRYPPRPESAAGRLVGETAQDPLQHPDGVHPRLLRHRGLQPQQQHVRRRHDDPLRPAGVSLQEAGLSARPGDPHVDPGPPDGTEPARVPVNVAGGLQHLLHQSDLAVLSGLGRPHHGHVRLAGMAIGHTRGEQGSGGLANPP